MRARGTTLRERIAASSGVLIIATTLVLVAVVGWADYATGVELRVYPLYFLPISLAAWHVGRSGALAIGVASALAWGFSNRLADPGQRAAVLAFNMFAQLTAFSTVAILIVSQRERLDAERRLSRADPLTGAANSRAFDEVASSELDRSRRYQRPLTVVYIDLDDFKLVNDRLGHHRGDELLKQFAAALREAVRATDTVARLGGDEFAVLLPETGVEGARAVLQKLMQTCREALQEAGLSVSVGAITFRTVPADVDELIARVDAVMYDAKRSGKDALRHEVV